MKDIPEGPEPLAPILARMLADLPKLADVNSGQGGLFPKPTPAPPTPQKAVFVAPRPCWRVTLVPTGGGWNMEPQYRLRRGLKQLLRSHVLKCVLIKDAKTNNQEDGNHSS